MRRLKFGLLFGAIYMAGLLGCQSVPAAPEATLLLDPTPTVGLVATRTPSPTTKPSASPTATQAPSATLTPTPTLTATPTALACWTEGGQIILAQLEVEGLRQPLDYRVYLPPCYAELPEQRYPVLYLIHGQSFTDDQWDRLGVDETMDRLIAAGEIPQFLIVMPRDREWTQPDVDPFGKAVIEVLIPWIDQSYRTLPERAFRAVGGLSRGASWAIHFGLKYWELFGAVGGHSPPIFWSDVPHIKRWLDEIPAESLPRLWLDIGENDRTEIMDSARWFENLLTQRNIPHEWHLFAGYHEEAYWQAHVEQYLRWYARDW